MFRHPVSQFQLWEYSLLHFFLVSSTAPAWAVVDAPLLRLMYSFVLMTLPFSHHFLALPVPYVFLSQVHPFDCNSGTFFRCAFGSFFCAGLLCRIPIPSVVVHYMLFPFSYILPSCGFFGGLFSCLVVSPAHIYYFLRCSAQGNLLVGMTRVVW